MPLWQKPPTQCLYGTGDSSETTVRIPINARDFDRRKNGGVVGIFEKLWHFSENELKLDLFFLVLSGAGMMDIFEFAIQMECDGEQFYRDLASKTPHKGLQTILLLLAEDEKKHAGVIAAMQTEAPAMEPTAVLDNAKNVFVQMKAFGGRIDLSGDEPALYAEAMVLEQRSVSFYLDRADEVKQADQKALFQRLAEEEKKHYRLLEELAELVKKPKTWLENAEFSHLLDDY